MGGMHSIITIIAKKQPLTKRNPKKKRSYTNTPK